MVDGLKGFPNILAHFEVVPMGKEDYMETLTR
jgi:hypothetical protein